MHRPADPRIASPGQSSAPPVSAVVALVVAHVALAFGPWFVRLADVGPVAAGFWRIALAVPVLFAAAALFSPGGMRGTARWWPLLLLSGVAFAADLGSWHIGIVRTTLANSTLFGNSATLFFPIYGFIVARTWPNRSQGFALALAAVGAGLLLGRSAELSPRNLAGDLFCLLAGVLYTVYFAVMARVRTGVGPLPSLALSSLASVLPLLLLALALGEAVMPREWGPLVALAIVSQVIGQGAMIYALGHLSPLVIGIALLLQPIVAGTIGWIAYGERLTALDLVGAVCVGIALVLVRRGSAGATTVAPGGGATKSDPA